MVIAADHIVRGLNEPGCVAQLIRTVRQGSPEKVVLDFQAVNRIFPNGAVPFAVALDYFTGEGVQFQAHNSSPEIDRTHTMDPLTVDQFVRYETPLTNVVWKYRSESEAGALANYFIDALMHNMPCEEGVVDSLNWCLYEIMDNVFQHSQARAGFVMMQLHRTSRKCVVAISDSGIGIQKSLVDSYRASGQMTDTHIVSADSAIAYAIRPGITSKAGRNQGNGLFGLQRSVEINGGRLEIRSGRGVWRMESGTINSDSRTDRPVLEPNDHQGTTVDWQLDCSKSVRITDALGVPDRGSPLLEGIEDDLGEHRLIVRELEDQLGSRAKGEEIKNLLLNYLDAGARNIVLDFRGVGVVSSSFADEVLGKIALQLGELDFRRRIRIENATSTIRAIIERAIALRIDHA